MDKRWLWFFTFLSFVVFLFALVVILSTQPQVVRRNDIVAPTVPPSPTPIPGTIYQNKNFNYQFSLPESWEVKPQTQDESVINILPSDYKKEDEVPINISVTKNVSNKTIDEWVNIFFTDKHPREEIQIGAIKWIRIRSALSTYQAVIYFTQYQGYIYELYNSVLKGSDGEVFHQILPTFSFTQ